jgi:hypothetical protein
VQAALYVATPELCQRAAASVAEASDRASLFKHLSQHWGVWTSGHPGITRESQVLALEPYLDLIAGLDLRQIADTCNRLGWFDLRKRLLDARIGGSRYVFSSESASAQFDSMLPTGPHYWIDLQIEEVLKTGSSWDEFLGALRAWFAERQTVDALRLLAAALARKGSRRDLSALRIYDAMPREAGTGKPTRAYREELDRPIRGDAIKRAG